MCDISILLESNSGKHQNIKLMVFLQIAAIRKTSKFEDEIREEQEEKRRELEEKNKRQQSFKERAALFGGKGV